MLLNLQPIILLKQIVSLCFFSVFNTYIYVIFLVSFDTPSTFALSIYSLFYLLYLLYPNNLRRELQPESIQSINSNEKPTNRLGIERVLLVSYFTKKININK